MKGFNQCIFLGNVGNDPEIKTFESGKKKASFSLATTNTFKDEKGEKVSVTEWHNIVFWGKSAELAEKLIKKGAGIHVIATHKTETWEDENGKHYKSIFVADSFVLVDKKQAEEETE